MAVLVTGCAGFIGWRTAELLLERGTEVWGIDELNHAYDVRLKRWRLQRLQRHPGFHFRRMDVCDRAALEGLFRAHRFEAVVNLAARAGVRQSLRDPWAYLRTNAEGTLNLLELCRLHGVRKFVLASTSSVYGEAERPFREEAATDRPLSPYAASKKAAEAIAYAYHRLYGLDVSVLRYFTVYGPAGRPDMSIFRFVQRIAEGRPIVVFGDGSQERDFTYVDDIARGTLSALRPLGHQVINLGSDRPVPLARVIELVEQMVGRRAVVERRAPHPADVPATWACIERARRLLGWEPRVGLEEGLRRCVSWYLAQREWASLVNTEED